MALQAQYTTSPEHSLVAVSDGQDVWTAADPSGRVVERQLGFGFCLLVVVILLATTQTANRRLQDGAATETTFAVEITITDPENGATVYPLVGSVGAGGLMTTEVPLTLSAQVSDDDTGLCEGCTMGVVVEECLSGSCADYDIGATNANMDIQSAVSAGKRGVYIIPGAKI